MRENFKLTISIIKQKFKNPYLQSSLFLFTLVGLYFFLGLNKLFFVGPYGIHFMRQTDSLSFASNYFNNGFAFLKPQLYNLKNINGMAVCEFPLTYYITAIFYTIIGKHFFIQRLIHLFIIYFGIFSIYKLSNFILKDFTYSLLISLVVFTSTVFNYYSFNYLPDIPALGFVLIGWFYSYKYHNNNKTITLILSFVFFTLGSLIKVTYLINPIAIIILAIISLIFNKKKTLMSNRLRVLLYGLFSILIVLSWNIFVLYYNDLYSSTSFNTKPQPIWILHQDKIKIIWDHISNYWYNSYFSKEAFYLIYAFIILQILFIKKSNKNISLQILILFFGNLTYFILFYKQFQDHDYYFLVFFPLVLLILINGIKTLQNTINNNVIHSIIKLIIFVIIIVGINHSRNKLNKRLIFKKDIYSQTGLLINENIKNIQNLNISPLAKFIIAPDLCQNGGLFYLNKSGWNIEKTEQITLKKIKKYKNKGAEYLLLASTENSILQIGEKSGKLIFKNNEISIYKLNKDINLNEIN